MKLSELIREELRISAETGAALPAAITARLHECVKPLRWTHIVSTGDRYVHEAGSALGTYTAWPDGGWKLRGTYQGGFAANDRSLSGAQAAAQAHYAKMMMEGWNL